MNIIDYLSENGYATVDNSYYSYIEQWMEWYQGKVEKFHKYTIYNGIAQVPKERYSLGMAKRVAEDWANLLMNEKVAITCKAIKDLDDIFEYNNFNVRANQLVELSYALGTGAFVEYLDKNENIIIDYIRADMIYPLGWDNGDITECAFASNRKIDGKECVYMQMHLLEDGKYVITNVLIDADSGVEIELDGIESKILTGSEKPLYQIILPNIVNNVDLDCPMGISVYANGVDQLKGVDLVYDSYMNEFDLGKKRIMVPASMAKIEMGADGVMKPIFDSNDTTFYAIANDKMDGPKEISMDIRADQHELGLQRGLNLLSSKCGLGNDRYSFEKGTAKTATEVISEKSDLYQNLKKNEIPLKSALVGMVKAIGFLSGNIDVDVDVDFDDSIIEDSNAVIDKNIKLTSAGLRSKITALMDVDKCTEKEAQTELEKINNESMVSGDEADAFNMDGDNENQEDNPEETEAGDE